jgi:hypothetical protein
MSAACCGIIARHDPDNHEESSGMPDNKKTITWRSEAYSDIADSAPFRTHVVKLTEDAFARLVLREVRERGGSAALSDLREEWMNSGAGSRIYEISAQVADAAGQPAIEVGSSDASAAVVDDELEDA